MYQTHKTYIKPEMKMLDLINENYALLLFLQHFNIDFSVNNSSIEQICRDKNIDLPAFLVIINLYNGFFPEQEDIEAINGIKNILVFLKNSHTFYKDDKYPELMQYLTQLKKNRQPRDIQLIDQFLNDYFKEVFEHLDYEDNIAFPYFYSLLEGDYNQNKTYNFSVKEYTEHHTDIEAKLSDLKNLLLKHLHFNNDLNTRRKFLNSLFSLEFDLKIHSFIEEKILIPKISALELSAEGTD